MKRLAIFAVTGPLLAPLVLYAMVLPAAGWLEGAPVTIDLAWRQVPVLMSSCLFAAIAVSVFDWTAAVIQIAVRPLVVAVIGWILAAMTLHNVLALPDLPGWIIAIGLIGAIPSFVCSWLTACVADDGSLDVCDDQSDDQSDDRRQTKSISTIAS